jgi:tRNA pseudouridine55 synthase
MDGIINIDKPVGKTSFAVVATIKRLTRERRVGHGGTLDPMASGVLPVCLGRGTRVVEFLAEARKTYAAEITLGVATDTYDTEGRVTQRGDPSGIEHETIVEALKPFRGRVAQRPPMYSAVKHNGRRLYELARMGITVERPLRPAHIYRIELVNYDSPLLTLEVECGKGTYIRSIADDLGRALGCGAHLTGLVRTAYGPFRIEDAVSLDGFEAASREGQWEELVQPLGIALETWPAVTVSDEQGHLIVNGRPLSQDESGIPSEAETGGRLCAYSQEGCLLAVLKFRAESGQWHPAKVFSRQQAGAVPAILDS